VSSKVCASVFIEKTDKAKKSIIAEIDEIFFILFSPN
jgi:hypothetical protein